MAFTDNKSPGDLIQSQDWDDHVDFSKEISSNAYGHSGNTSIHAATQGNLTASLPLSFNNTRKVIGGAAQISVSQSDASTDGYLSSTDWSTFNSKLHGTTASGTFYLSSLAVGLSGTVATLIAFSSNTGLYYPSSLGKGISSQVYSNKLHSSNSNIHLTSTQLTDLTDGGTTTLHSHAGGGISGWYDLDTGTGINSFGGAVSISGTQAETLSVKGYATISGNAVDTKAWYDESSSKISDFIASGDKYSTAYTERGSQIDGDGLAWDGTNLDVQGYATISGNARDSKEWYDTSSQKLSDISGNLVNKINAVNLADLDDITDMTNKSDNDVLTWDTTQSKWSSQATQAGDAVNWYDLGVGTGIAAFGGSISISGTQNENITIDFGQTDSEVASGSHAHSNIPQSWLKSGTYWSDKAEAFPSAQLVFTSPLTNTQPAIYIIGDASPTINIDGYIASANVLANFYPSALGVGVSSAVLSNTLHSANSALHTFNVVNYITSTNSISRFADSSQYSTDKVNWQAAYDHSGAAIGLYYPSALGKGVSGAVLANTLHSANSALHSFDTTLYMTSANIIANYTNSTQAITRYADSSNVNRAYLDNVSSNALQGQEFSSNARILFYPSSLGTGVSSNVKILDDWFEVSSASLSDHLADNTQAHSDYLLNSGDDSSSGVITASGFMGSLSGSNISGGTIQVTTFAGGTNATAVELEELTDGSTTTLHDHDDTYYTEAESNAISSSIIIHSNLTYYPSSLGKGISGAVLANTLHSANSALHTFSTVNYMTSTNSITRFADSSQYSTDKANWQAAFDHSGAAIGLYYPSALGKGVSGAVLANTLHSANSALHTFDVTLYMTSANIIANYANSTNIYNTTWIDTFSGNVDTRIDALGGFLPANYMTSANIISNYVTSTNAISRYADSSNTQTKYMHSGLILNAISSTSISGGTILTSTLNLNADTISGLATPTFPSSAVNKIYVDTTFYPSSLGVGVSSAVLANTLHSANSSLHTFSVEGYMTSTNSLANFYPSTLGVGISGAVLANTLHSANSALHTFDVTSYMTSTNIISNYSKSANIIARYYPSSLGKGISGAVLPLSTWYTTSSQKYSLAYQSGQNALQDISDGVTSWNSSLFTNSGLLWDGSDWVAKASGGAGGATTLDALTDTALTSPVSGEILVYKANNARWENELPAMNFNVANVRLLSGQNINVTRFTCPTNAKAYVWQASCANSGGASVSGLSIEILSGNCQTGNWDSIYKTSSAILQQGYPLGVSAVDSDIEIRLMYSGSHIYGGQGNRLQYATGLMQVSVY